jgi:hypothetical protein
MASKILKITVKSSGTLLLDGNPITVEALETPLQVGARHGAVVHYYSENRTATPLSKRVLDAVVRHRLQIYMASRPDFSDAQPLPISPPTVSDEFAPMRAAAAAGKLVVVRPDGGYLGLRASTDGVPPERVEGARRMLPPPQNLAVIAATDWTMASAPSLQAANEAIPFFGLLMGLSSVGNAVWIFDGAPALLAAGCRDANVLIVDSERLPRLPRDWEETALWAMRGAKQVLVHDRERYQLRPP